MITYSRSFEKMSDAIRYLESEVKQYPPVEGYDTVINMTAIKTSEGPVIRVIVSRLSSGD